MAIALDTTSTSGWGHGTGLSWSHTCTGSQLVLIVDAVTQYGNAITGVTYNGVAMTQIGAASTANQNGSSWYLINPATGSHTVAVSYTTNGQHNWAAAKSYTGVDQTTPIDSSNTGTATSGTSKTISTTVVVANCWLAAGAILGSSTISSVTVSSNKTDRQGGTDSGHYMGADSCDSNATVATGSQSIIFTPSSGNIADFVGIIYSLTPFTATAPTVTTQAVTSITDTTATGNGNVTSDGGATITERGTVISTSANPTTSDTKFTASGTTGAFTTSITGRTAGTLYHVRAYAINSVGTSYGSDVTFTTLQVITLIMGQGSFALTGQTTTLTSARTITADQGSFALNGQSVNFAQGKLMTIDSGSFLLNGQSIGFNSMRHIDADQGSFLLNGQDANMSINRNLVAETGYFLLNGQVVRILINGSTAYFSRQAKHTSSFAKQTKHTSIWTNQPAST